MKQQFAFWLSIGLLLAGSGATTAQDLVYDNVLKPLKDPRPLLADHPEFVEPIRTGPRFEGPTLVSDAKADLSVRAWRFSYNARCIIETPNRLEGRATAVIVVHPWGIDDGQGWKTPEPAGVAFACTPFKNELTLKHMQQVVDPFVRELRPRVGLVAYSLPGKCDPVRKKLYRSFAHEPSESERLLGQRELAERLKSFNYRGEPLPQKMGNSDFLVGS